MASYGARSINEVEERIASAARSAGRDPSEITLIAVSKTVGLEEVAAAIDAGVRDFGENRPQEFVRKYEAFCGSSPHVRWHLIGSLQTNKVKDVVGRAALIHSVDSVKLLHKIDAVAARLTVVQPVLLQVNVSGEESKHGFSPDEIEGVLQAAGELENITINGFMTMAPASSPAQATQTFCGLSMLRQRFASANINNVDLQELSMGMSGDYELAIAQGATMIRVGRALFAEE